MKRRIKQWLLTGMVLSLSLSVLSACNLNRGDTVGDGEGRQVEQQRFNPAPFNQNRGMNDQSMRHDQQGREKNWIAESQAAAERVAEMKEIDSASVLMTNRNAYVAVMVENDLLEQLPFTGNAANQKRGEQAGKQVSDRDVSNELKEKIAQQVKSVEPDVQNVYVSANPDFVGQINNYMTDLREGRPLTGLMEELNDIVERMFPENAAKQTNRS